MLLFHVKIDYGTLQVCICRKQYRKPAMPVMLDVSHTAQALSALGPTN